MNENILVCIAWPYANADIHQGNVTGSHLPGDIYVRFHRLKGNNAIMVSGSDTHGTPVTIKATELGKSIPEVYEDYHQRFLETFMQLGISYDLYTHTDTENHHKVAQDIFTNLRENEFVYRQKSMQMYSAESDRFLPDRYVEGTCPNCGYTSARGDQCDNCNTLFESAAELIDARSKVDNTPLELRETKHFFIDLPALAEAGLETWLATDKDHWRPQVINFARRFVADGLIGRAITRDMDWGIAIPESGYDLPDHEKKVMYVWFEAVIGYLSATVEWAKNNGTPEAWKDWWYGDNARIVNFLGKDNIPFHAVMWPAELLGLRGLYHDDPTAKINLPYDVAANQFMNMEGHKISGSRNWGVWMLEAMERHDPDPMRYYLTVTMPESRDSDWSWQGYVERNNNELVANWGNLVNRVLSMTKRYFKGVVPAAGELTADDQALLDAVDAGFVEVSALYDACKFRAAVQEILRISTLVNQYMEEMKPWTTAKTDMTRTGTTL
ncbi:MAG TPA: methionine--tRNA ligase, partial [Anaerolineae bacterium]|nr:methionine--tRNA ligase [Anaerolineae bacterium]